MSWLILFILHHGYCSTTMVGKNTATGIIRLLLSGRKTRLGRVVNQTFRYRSTDCHISGCALKKILISLQVPLNLVFQNCGKLFPLIIFPVMILSCKRFKEIIWPSFYVGCKTLGTKTRLMKEKFVSSSMMATPLPCSHSRASSRPRCSGKRPRR